MTFSAQTLDATTSRTCHIITYDAKNAGSATLTITSARITPIPGRSTARSTREPSTIPKEIKQERYICQISYDVSGCGTLRDRLCKRRAPYKEDLNPEPAGTTGYLSIGNLDDGRLRRNRNPSRRHVGRDAGRTHRIRDALRLPTWTALSWRSSTPTTRRFLK